VAFVSALGRILDKLLGQRRQRHHVTVRVHRRMLDASHEREAYVISVWNESLEQSVTVTHVWVETPTKISVLTKRLPVTIAPGQEWETWIEARELPPGTADVEHVVRVAFGDDIVIAPVRHEPVAQAGFQPD
jgi:hypothetical protein